MSLFIRVYTVHPRPFQVRQTGIRLRLWVYSQRSPRRRERLKLNGGGWLSKSRASHISLERIFTAGKSEKRCYDNGQIACDQRRETLVVRNGSELFHKV